LKQLGFSRSKPKHTGRPGYHPATLLKLYVYGYLNRIQSSRRLEREAHRNVELMWLIERLVPDFKTIADFRKDNGKGIRNACRTFVDLCRQLQLFTDAVVAIDGSKFKAVNNRDKNFSQTKMRTRLERTEECINRYLADLDIADKTELDSSETKQSIVDKIDKLKRQMKKLYTLEKQRKNTPDKQLSLTDPDSRSMATHGRGSGMVGYNVQSAVDTKHHLIVAHKVTNVGSDRKQLAVMSKLAKSVIQSDKLIAIADRGYYSGKEILAVHGTGISPLVPKTNTSSSHKYGRYDKSDFIYMSETNEYLCPAGQQLKYHCTHVEKGMNIHKYWSNACPNCTHKNKCTTSNQRRVRRWEHENVLDEMADELAKSPDAMTIRKSTVEHPFGTIKSWMGATHFQMKRLKNVSTEMSLHVLAYNMKRVMNIIGEKALLEAIRA